MWTASPSLQEDVIIDSYAPPTLATHHYPAKRPAWRGTHQVRAVNHELLGEEGLALMLNTPVMLMTMIYW